MNYQRLFLLMGLILSLFTALLGRIFYFQAIKGEEIARSAAAMRSQKIELWDQQRGAIMDRYQQPLTNTTASTALFVSTDIINHIMAIQIEKNPGFTEAEYYEQLSASIADLVKGLNRDEIKALIQAERDEAQFVMIKSELDQSEIEQLAAAAIPGLVVAPFTERYRHDGFLAHVLGYTDHAWAGTGMAGIEKGYDSLLRSQTGGPHLVAVVDARGQAIPGLAGRLQASRDERSAVVLTIDRRIQEVVEQAMDHRAERGAAVVMDVHSKEVLAMVSRPVFDPYRVDTAIGFDGRSPLTNRALSSYYPGSLFKILLTAAALEEGLVTFEDHFNCSGKYVFNDQVSISCLKKEGHGTLRFDEAFARSCNPTFIEAGLRLGRTRLLNYVDKMHLTDETLLGYENTAMGSYVKIDGGAAAMGNASLGQQGVMVTPLQIASLLATVADNGVWAYPSLVKYTIDQDGHRTTVTSGERQQVISPSTAAKLRVLLEKVVQEGTGRTAAIPEAPVAGKTATSQTGRMISENEEALNTWFAGYLPADEPRWVVVVLVEEGRSGSENCAPIFRDISQGILQYY